MIQDKVNQLLGIGTLITHAGVDRARSAYEINDKRILHVMEYAPTGMINKAQLQENLGLIQPEESILGFHKATKTANEALKNSVYSVHEMMMQKGTQSMQEHGGSKAIQKYNYKALMNDLANEDTQSISRDIANTLKKGERNG